MNSHIFHISLYGLAFLGAIFIGLNFAVLLWFTKSINRGANRFLALALFTMVLWMARLFGIDIRLETYLPHWDWLPMQFLLALGPLMYFYVLKITRPQYKFQWKDMLHFSPLLVELGALALEIRESNKTGTAAYATHAFQQLNPLLQLLTSVSIITYLHQCNTLIQAFYRRLQPVLMDRPLLEFRWLRRLLAATALLWFFWIGSAAADYFVYHNQPNSPIYYPFYIFFAVIIIWTAAAAFLKPHAAAVAQPAAPVNAPIPVELRAKAAWLKKAMEVNQYYEDPELSLSSLAEKLEMHPHELSKLINTVFKKSFNELINEYRVMDVISKMQSPAYSHITLLGIAYEAGFNSKTSFHRIFKQITGKTPAEFKITQQNKVPPYQLAPRLRSAAVISNHQTTPLWAELKLNRHFMFRNYFKLALRNLLKSKLYSFINIGGLAIGLACCLTIGLFIWDELNYDRFNTNGAAIYRVVERQNQAGVWYDVAVTPGPLAGALAKDMAEVKQTCRLDYPSAGVLELGTISIEADKVFAADNSFFTMFNFPLVKGDAGKALLNPGDVVLSETMAAKLFGKGWGNNAGIIGSTIIFNKNRPLQIAGIAKDAPVNSHIQFSVLTSTKIDKLNTRRYNWGNNNYLTYVQLQPGTNAQAFGSKLTKYLTKYNPETKTTLSAQPLFDVYLYSHFDFNTDWTKTSNITYIRVFSAVGIVVLLIAIFNFINLATARAIHRAREVGVRKAIGAFRRQLVAQFLGESLFMTGVSVIIALVLLRVFLPLMNSIAGKAIAIPIGNLYFALSIIAFALLVSLLAGIYPAFYLSKFRPAKVLKGIVDVSSGQFFRRSLVVGQFMFSIILIIGAIVIYRQLTYMQDKDLGFNRQQLLTVKLKSDLQGKAQLLKADLLKQKGVADVSASSTNLVNVTNSTWSIEWQGQAKDDNFLITQANIDPDFLHTTGMQLAAGRNFNAAIIGDTSSAYIVNETAAKRMGYTTETAVGKTIAMWGRKGAIIGVVKDFYFRPLTATIEPFSFHYWPVQSPQLLFVKTTAGGARDAIASINTTYKKYDKQTAVEYSFVDKMLEQQYLSQQRTASIILYFSILAIFVSCLGLFGLATFAAEQRTKEIGIRKVLGATVTNIVTLFSRDFIKLVIIAIVIAMPIAWYIMTRWLQDFAYRINIEWWMLLLAAALCIGITLLTVGLRAIKAAIANPVRSLRTE